MLHRHRTQAADPAQLYTKRAASYEKFVSSVRYPQALQDYFRHSRLLKENQRILDAGCGTGLLSLSLYRALQAREIRGVTLKGFDLTPAMLSRFGDNLRKAKIDDIELCRANVLELGTLPADWIKFDVIVSASMMEYVPRDQFAQALAGLRGRLEEGGKLLLFITRRNLLMRPLIGQWWKANLYTKEELREQFNQAGFTKIQFRHFGGWYSYFNIWGHIVEAN